MSSSARAEVVTGRTISQGSRVIAWMLCSAPALQGRLRRSGGRRKWLGTFCLSQLCRILTSKMKSNRYPEEARSATFTWIHIRTCGAATSIVAHRMPHCFPRDTDQRGRSQTPTPENFISVHFVNIEAGTI
ncbi:hypothetical protein OESDEN_03347 [Oesophagostomum dentatum]|uniref:Uncharacterized protein n=1 Tax=Oesophagostomum dentatum TaxID=61180 RepID=A0A0B1TLK9_OESDE|nr:hypothetical protein OESDEN_03347 [Oesophagostomum dentatum]